MVTMNDDLEKYELFGISSKGYLYPVITVKTTDDYNHYMFHIHHFVRKSIRKNYPKDYKRFEPYQKLIIMPKEMNLDLETMGESAFYEKYKINKFDLVFDRKKWRDGYYDNGYDRRRIL
jgi:hypothetical protein